MKNILQLLAYAMNSILIIIYIIRIKVYFSDNKINYSSNNQYDNKIIQKLLRSGTLVD